MRKIIVAAAVLATLATLAAFYLSASPAAGDAASAAASTAPAVTDGDAVVARIDGQPVTLDELEGQLAGQLRQLESQRFQLLEQGLTALIDQRLVAAEAAARGITADQLLAAEVEAKSAPVSDEEVDSWYEQNKDRVRQPKEQIAEQIRAFLNNQRQAEARAALLSTLRAEHQVKVLLEPPRVELELAGAQLSGPADAPVTLVEFSDFQCPACKRVNPALDEIKERYGDRLTVAFRQFPLRSIHPQAQKAAEASLCAAEQDKFWQMHDALFEDQGNLETAALKQRARQLGLDGGAFDRCLDSGATAERVAADFALGQQIGVGGTPTMFVNGRQVNLVGGKPFTDQLAQVIDQELERAD